MSTPTHVALFAAGAVALGIVWSVLISDAPADDGIRPAWVGTCGGVAYRWHYDPRTVPSGADCVVERIER